MVEPVFGQIKAAMGIYGFMLRGIDAVRSQWKLICSCHNLVKLFRAYGVVPTTQGEKGRAAQCPLRVIPYGYICLIIKEDGLRSKIYPKSANLLFTVVKSFATVSIG